MLNVELHPVDPKVRSRIHDELDSIEEEYGVEIIYACESGSRAWGFSSTDSDYDVRFIYVDKPKAYMCINRGRDVIEKPIDRVLDISGWSLDKALGLMWKSNPALYEWLDSPIVYRENANVMDEFRKLAPSYFKQDAAWHHYRSLCFNTYDRHLVDESVRLKKYFYALRPIMAAEWVVNKGTIPPMVFEELCRDIENDELMAEIQELLELKRHSTETSHILKRSAITAYITEFLEKGKPTLTRTHCGSIAQLNDYLYRTVQQLA